jgi:hypothetical protein
MRWAKRAVLVAGTLIAVLGSAPSSRADCFTAGH